MFSSEKVLQMSYANYQSVSSVPFLLARDDLKHLCPGARKHLLRSSRIPVSWTNEKRGSLRSFILNQAPSKVSLSRSLLPLIRGARNVVRIIVARFTSPETQRYRIRISCILSAAPEDSSTMILDTVNALIAANVPLLQGTKSHHIDNANCLRWTLLLCILQITRCFWLHYSFSLPLTYTSSLMAFYSDLSDPLLIISLFSPILLWNYFALLHFELFIDVNALYPPTFHKSQIFLHLLHTCLFLNVKVMQPKILSVQPSFNRRSSIGWYRNCWLQY